MKKIFLVAALFLGACQTSSKDALTTIYLTSPDGGRITLNVEVADTPEKRATGLMYRQYLPEDVGMLFIFDEEQTPSFWMKNTVIPLDILFFNARGKLVSSARMEPCTAEPCPRHISEAEALYALEVAAGFTDRHTLHSDWKILLPAELLAQPEAQSGAQVEQN